MVVFLSARYGRREEIKEVAEEVVMRGHVVRASWVWMKDPIGEDWRIQVALRDIADLEGSDTMVAFTEDPFVDETGMTRGGRHVEFGLGLRMGLRMCVVGPRENIYHYVPQVMHFSKTSLFLEWLEGERKER